MKKEVYACDMCGTQKGEQNHWFIGILPITMTDWVTVTKWADDTAADRNAKHLCGQACVHKFVDEFLSQ